MQVAQPTQGYGPQQGYGPPRSPYMPTGARTPYGNNPYGGGDVYRPTGPYQHGYVQGAGAASGAANAVSSASSGFANIFTSLTSVIAKILNTIVTIIAKIIKGILGIFGIGKKKDKGAEQQQQQQNMPPLQPGATRPGQIPPPPPGTDIAKATEIVRGDLQAIQDPGQAFRAIDLHAKKALDNRRFAQDESVRAERLAGEAAQLAQRIASSQGRMHPQELNQIISDLEIKKSSALDALKRAEDYTKATYDEALYAQLATDMMVPKFQQVPAFVRDAMGATDEAWKAWTTGVTETKYLFMKETHPPAPEVFTRAVGAVNNAMSQIDQILGQIMVRR